ARVQRHTTMVAPFIHVLVMTAAILGLIWCPVSVREFLVLPLLIITTVSLVVCLLRMARKPDALGLGGSTIIRPAARGTGLALLFLALSWAVAAQPATPPAYAVYLIEAKQPLVLAPPNLIAKLDDAARPPSPGKGAVLLRAKYTGRVKDASARFDVEYQIHCSKDDHVVVPLSSVQLHEGAFLDGVPVFPSAHEAGYSLPIKGAGIHHLRLSFSVNVASNGDYLDLKFTAPRLVQNSMQVDWASPVQGLLCLHCRGEEKRSLDGRQAVTEWRGQLGAEKAVHLRWTNPATQPTAKLAKVREAHFWDLRPGSESLATVLHYAVGAGSLSQLNIALPDGLHVRGVEATYQVQTLAPQPLLIKQWRVNGKSGQRRLVIDLAQPSTGTIVLHLDIVPQLPIRERKLLLRLPAPLQVESVAGLLGYRLDADENPSAQDITVQSVTPEEFDALWKKSAGAPLTTAASRAYRFLRKSQQAGLELERRGDTRQAQMHLNWRLEPRHADLVGKFTIKSAFEDLMLLEFQVDPGLTLSNVVGAEVKRWHQLDSLLQVWLKQPRKQATLDVLGWHAFNPKDIAVPKRPLALPRVLLRGGQVVKADLEVQPGAGIRIAEPRLRALKAPYQASVTMSVASQAPEVETLTRIHGSQQGVDLRHAVLVPTDRGRLPILKLNVKDWHGDAAVIDAPGAIVRSLKTKGAGDAAWSIQYPPGLPQVVVIYVRGRLDPDKQGTVVVPTFALEGGKLGNNWIAWKDLELTGAGKKLADKAGVRGTMPAAWQRETTGFNANVSAKSIRATLPKTTVPTSARILASTESIRRAEAHWLHEESLWVYTPEAGELRIRFPAPLVSFSALADQRQTMATKSQERDVVVLPLPASPRPRVIELHWKYEAGAESLRSPILAALKIDQDLLSSPLRMLWIPRDMIGEEARPTPSLFEQLMQQADTHLQVSAVLAEEPQRSADIAKKIAVQQQQFVACTAQAEYAARLIKHALPDYDTSALLDRLSDLRRENEKLAKKRGYDTRGNPKSTVPAEPAATTDIVSMGTPILLPPAASSLTLQSLEERRSSERHTRSELVLLSAVALLLFSLFRRSFALATRFAPELAIAMCVAAMLLFGVSLIAFVAIGLALLVRAGWLIDGLRRRKAAADADATVAAMPSAPESNR
ncbi:MAG TPA: hypothetical protein VFE62_25085, partial [Gemmataceae bacterium]|nr:hypothetical protein [Gemmataceae bacterium]